MAGKAKRSLERALDTLVLDSLNILPTSPKNILSFDFQLFCSKFLRIKNRRRQLVPLLLNAAQQRFISEMSGHDIILKARQMGFSTLILALIFYDTILKPHTTSIIIAHKRESTSELFSIISRFHQNLPNDIRPHVGRDNKYEMTFPGLDSKILTFTAGDPLAGRAYTIDNLHCSEVAMWHDPDETMASLLNSVSDHGRIFIESTARGIGGFFHKTYSSAKQSANEFKPHFFPWTLDPEYQIPLLPNEEIAAEPGLSAQQTKWKILKVQRLNERFPQEFPQNDTEAFLSSDKKVFLYSSLKLALQQSFDPVSRYEVASSGALVPAADGRLKVWYPPVNDQSSTHLISHNYCLAADVANGAAAGDYSCLFVLDKWTGQIVASWHGYIDPALFAETIISIAKFYNNSLVSWETNNMGHAVTVSIRHRYPYLYKRRISVTITDSLRDELGWNTTIKTKPQMISSLQFAIRQGSISIPDKDAIDELVKYEYKENGTMGAPPGEHDDRVMALAQLVEVASTIKPSIPIRKPFEHGTFGHFLEKLEERERKTRLEW